MDELLRRYRSGDHARVWKDLTPANGLDVARDTMARVRKNLELLEKRLRETGYAFAGDICPAFCPPPSDQADVLRHAEEAFGPLPLALRTFYEVVGAVDFRAPDGKYAGKPWSRLDMADPLVVWPLKGSFESNYGEWESMNEAEREEYGPFHLEFAPDACHKDNVSGGPPYAIALPNPEVDPPLYEDVTRMTFLGHLRLAIRNGGFLRMESQGIPSSNLDALTKDLLPF